MLKTPKLYQHETCIGQKAAGGLGGPGPWRSPGEENVLAFSCSKDKSGLK